MNEVAAKLRAKIAKLQRKLDEVETGVVDVYPGEKFTKPPRGLVMLNAHMQPITRIYFAKDHIAFWGGAECLTLNIVRHDDNQEFTVNVVRP